MYKFLIPSLVIFLAFMLFPVMARAVPEGLTLTFPGGAGGPVTFDGAKHAAKGFSCDICHTAGLFKTKKGADKMTMALMKEGKFCGFCHNGKKAFAMGDNANCKRCHKK
jgi:c(7)-type cytochrome triheme protein